MAVVRWTFFDPANSTTVEFPINPETTTMPSLVKKITQESTVASDGRVVLFEGRDEPMRITFNGTILDQDHWAIMTDWFAKRRQVLLTDDLGMQMWVYLTKFTSKRENRVHYPWYMKYDAELTILDWPA